MQKQFAPRVFQLGYVALETPDIARAKDHYAETIGMTETATGHDGESYLSIGYEHHNIVLRQAKQKAMGHLGFQLNPGTDLREVVAELGAFGLSAQIKSDSQPGIRELVEVEPVPGTTLQLYTDMMPPRPASSAPACRRSGWAMWR